MRLIRFFLLLICTISLDRTFETVVSKVLPFGFPQINLENLSLNRTFVTKKRIT